jgi:hypothetical protein
MFRRPMTRLAVTVAAAGTICAVGASAASAAPDSPWTGPRVVPGAITNDSPGIGSITFPVPNGQGQIVGWRGRGNAGAVFYEYHVPGLHKGHFSAKGVIGGLTSSAPAFGSYIDPYGHDAVLAVWTGHADHHIWFSQGETHANGTISWTKEVALPKSVANTNTSAAPSVLFTANAYRVIIAWRGPGTHVRFVVGTPHKRGFIWGASRVVPGPSVTKICKSAPCTGSAPALAEVNASGIAGIYFVWQQKSTTGAGPILYSTTPDNAVNLAKPVFTGPITVPGAASDLGPAASDTGLNGFGPLLLAYKAPFSTHVRYQILSTGGTWSGVGTVPDLGTVAAPALLLNELANTTSGQNGKILLRFYAPPAA